MPFLRQLLAELLEVVDDAVVDHGNPPGAVALRVGVDLGRLTVGGPAGMPDAGRAVQRRQRFGQRLDPDGVLADLDAVVQDGDAAGIIAAVLQLAEAVEEDRLGLPGADITDDAAHV